MFFNEYPYLNLTDLNLDYLLKNYKKLFDTLGQIDGWIENHEQEYNELKKAVEDLENGNWSPEFVNTLIDWYRNNIVDIIGDMVKQVFFGLTDSGYFVAYIPSSWSDIVFKTTGYDTVEALMPEYGHLVIKY